MKTAIPKCLVVAMIAMTLLASISCNRSKSSQAQAQEGEPGAIAVATATATATVQSVDPNNRTVTLQMSDGTTRTYKAGKDVVNFDQIKPGDQVQATVVEALAVSVRKSGTPPNAGEGQTVALAPQGAKPGIIMADTTELTAKIQSIDTKDRTVTLQGPEGNTRTYKVGPDINLANLKAGDDVTARYTQALALLVEQPQSPVKLSTGTPPPPRPEKLSDTEAAAIGTDAYIYGYPLVTMELTRRVMTNVAHPEGKHAPMDQFARLRTYPTPEDKEVTAPNADTLYTIAWLNVAKEPYVLSIPDAKGRYYLMPMLDGWTNVFQAPGKRTTGTNAQTYAITGPNWKGQLPQGVTEYKSPTSMVWIIGRIYCDGTPQDYHAVHEMQDQCSLVPLSSYGKPYAPPTGSVDPNIDMKTPVRDQVNHMDAASYFKLLAQLMKDNPPAPDDAPMLASMAKIGLAPGYDFDIGTLDPTVAKALQGVPEAAQKKIMDHFKDAGTEINGWTYSTKTGLYGTNYLQRAFITAIGLGANRPEDAIYPTSDTDADGKPYNGTNKYVMHFEKGQMPPVKGFWSLTMYDDQFFFVPNSLNRYTLSQRDKFTENPDGSVDLCIQHESPGQDKESNWLPAPDGKFALMLRFYWPEDSIVNGTWKPPAVKRVD